MTTRHTIVHRFFSLFLAFILAIGVFLPVASTQASAATLTYSTLNDVPEDYKIFDTIRKGTISAVKVSGTWYYQFKRSGYDTVRIKCSAFTASASNIRHLNYDNKTLNNKLAQNSRQNCDNIITYYNTRTTKDMGKYKAYTTNMYRFRLDVLAGAREEVVTKVRLLSAVQFTYNDKVTRAQDGRTDNNVTNYVTPSTASGYKAALKRSSSVAAITPVITLQVNNNKSGMLNLSHYTYSGRGNATASVDVNKSIGIIYSTGKALSTITTGNLLSGFNSLASIGNTTKNMLTKESSGYNTGEDFPLSKGEKYVVSTKLTSPIKLSQPGENKDYVQYTVTLGDLKNEGTSRSTSTLTVKFSFK